MIGQLTNLMGQLFKNIKEESKESDMYLYKVNI